MFNIFFKLAAASMFGGVSLGAKYGHVGQLDEDSVTLFNKALGLFACSMVKTASLAIKIAAGGFILGQLLFIIPLFIQAIKGRDSTFRFVIPIGGVAMMTAWLALVFV